MELESRQVHCMRFTVVSRMVTFPGGFFPGKSFPGKSFPGWSFSRIPTRPTETKSTKSKQRNDNDDRYLILETTGTW